ncbi:phage head morphogenesis protein [Flavobacterium soyangense]|uniref:Phage head morphogenesis protein n=1 Tax=Flavobacterium soyangense TaxID=2023265 RepID=A0A930XZK9_9FLAO|nr:phage minor head protein [Flavobacterium soyangense]MBF2707509.1 phage head morphogenesis protein [Flavobacterium soyangense]
MFDDRNVSEENKQALWEYYNTHLGKAFDLGYNSDSEFYDADLAQSLKNDIAKFSAFKETSFRAQLESALTEDGKVVSWSDFKKKATELSVEYNQRWLKTEYHHTVATANSVEQWKSFEADADLYPNLRYNAVNDARTREKHQALDGLILPINHVFWKTHNVPLDWGCRCKLEQTDEEPTKTVPDILVKGIFKNNAALSGKVFGEMPYASAMSAIAGNEAEKFAKEMQAGYNAEMKTITSKKEYESLGKTYAKKYFNKENGGYLAIDKERILASKINKNETVKFLKEEAMSMVYAKAGHQIKLLKEVAGVSSSDALVDGAFADLKKTASHNNILKYAKKATTEQGAEMILFEFEKETKDIYKEIEKLKTKKIKALYFFTGREKTIYKTF